MVAANVPLPEVVFFQEGPGLRKWQWTDDGMKVINVTNILGDAAGTVDVTNTDKFISLVEFEEKYQHFAVENGDFVVASSGNTYGKVGKVTEQCLPLMMNTSVVRFHSLNPRRLDNRYLYAFLRSPDFHNQVERFVIGGAQPNFGPSHLKKMTIPLPGIDKQKRIASILSAYDDLIENNRRRIQLLEQAARLLYKEWFVHLRFPGHEHTKIHNGLPEGWVKGTVLNLGQIVTGKTPSTKIPENFGGDIPFVKTPDMHRSRIIIETEESLSERGVATQSNKTLPVGTILVASIGAKLGVVSITSSLCQTNQQINAVIPRKDYMRYYSLFALIDLKPLLEAMGGGATMPNVNKTKFSSIPLVIPPPILLREFDGIVKTSFQQMQILHEQVSRLTRARDLLLPRLMNCEVPV